MRCWFLANLKCVRYIFPNLMAKMMTKGVEDWIKYVATARSYNGII